MHVMHLLVYSKFFPLQCNSVRQECLFLFFFPQIFQTVCRVCVRKKIAEHGKNVYFLLYPLMNAYSRCSLSIE